MYQPKELYSLFKKHKIEEKLSTSLEESVRIVPSSIECLKSTQRSSIYKLQVKSSKSNYPIIFKIYSSTNYKNEIEINLYTKAYPFLESFLPKIHVVESFINGGETWIFMECLQQIRGQLTFTPKHFDYIIPSISQLHAHTYEDNFHQEESTFQPWLPIYDSKKMRTRRRKSISKTMVFLQDAAKDKHLKRIIAPRYKALMKTYDRGPDFFPELMESGSSITHGDLHMQNICSKDVSKERAWDIQLIDWEGAKFASGWFDMIVLVEILLGFRKDWQPHAEEIRTHCINVYANEMQKRGIQFDEKPLDLYKMAYLQRTLEKGLQTQLRRLFDNRGGELLLYHLTKIETWGKDLGIYK
ncbi:hypothetical protein WAK64_19975 [Bacillus spongiae]|uniref:Phosphotransferase n=1 Tax=Bacillus spongiae TaxID=2683610 RepID=A0ABU8HJ08_9BACI